MLGGNTQALLQVLLESRLLLSRCPSESHVWVETLDGCGRLVPKGPGFVGATPRAINTINLP